MTKENIHYKSIFTNEQELLNAILILHNNSNDIELDPMFNKGSFYKDIINTPKYRFDINAIEKYAASGVYWTMNRFSSSYVFIVNINGGGLSNPPTNTYGVRPVIYLKSGTSALTFTGGEGTAEIPYELQ